jgi:hypothetical protein
MARIDIRVPDIGDFLGQAQMGEMNRVEGAAEDPDPLIRRGTGRPVGRRHRTRGRGPHTPDDGALQARGFSAPITERGDGYR